MRGLRSPRSITRPVERGEAADVIADLVRLTPTPEGYAVAARLWTTFGDRREAAALRAKARQLLAPGRLAVGVAPAPRKRFVVFVPSS